MNKIVINGSIDKELATILSKLCLQIQGEFDMSPLLLNNLINQQEFLSNCQFLYEQCHGEMMTNLDQFKENYVSALETNTKINIDGNEYEKCGHLNKTHKNGYIEYCNLHKYLHPHPQMPVTRKFGPEVDHDFVVKDDNQIIKERYNYSIYLIYQSYLNKLYCLIRQLFNYEINRSCEISTMIVNSENITNLLNQMTDHINIFKSKVLYEYINVKDKDTNTNTQLDPEQIETVESEDCIDVPEKTSFYYLKVYHCIRI